MTEEKLYGLFRGRNSSPGRSAGDLVAVSHDKNRLMDVADKHSSMLEGRDVDTTIVAQPWQVLDGWISRKVEYVRPTLTAFYYDVIADITHMVV